MVAVAIIQAYACPDPLHQCREIVALGGADRSGRHCMGPAYLVVQSKQTSQRRAPLRATRAFNWRGEPLASLNGHFASTSQTFWPNNPNCQESTAHRY